MLDLLLALMLYAASCATDTKDSGEDSGTPGEDRDRDGYFSAEDCDDEDPTVNPGALEVCDGLDNDCDGTRDEDVLTSFYRDLDGDGYGDEGDTQDRCEPKDGYVAVSGDCDDLDPSLNPGAVETCDGEDQDCDSLVDEDLNCAAVEGVLVPQAADGSVRVLPTEKEPWTWALGPACPDPTSLARDLGHQAWVTCPGTLGLAYLTTGQDPVAVPLPESCGAPVGVAMDFSRGLLVTCTGGQLLALDGAGAVALTVELGVVPGDPVPDRSGNVWIPHSSGVVVVTADGEVERIRSSATGSAGAAVAPDGTLWFPDTVTGQVCRASLSSGVSCFASLAASPHAIVFDHGGRALVVGQRDVGVVDARTLEWLHTWPRLFQGAVAGALAPDGLLQVVDEGAQELVQVDLEGTRQASWSLEGVGRGDLAGLAATDLAWPGQRQTLIADVALGQVPGWRLVLGAADLDGDGAAELLTDDGSYGAVCAWSGAQVETWATSGAHTCFAVGRTQYAWTGDLDGDSQPDLVVPDDAMGTVYILWGGRPLPGGVVSLDREADVALILEPAELAWISPGTRMSLADVDGDGFDDLFTGTRVTGTGPGAAWLLLGRTREEWDLLDGASLWMEANVAFESAAAGFGDPVLVVGDREQDGAVEVAVGAPSTVSEAGLPQGSLLLYSPPVTDLALEDRLALGDDAALATWWEEGLEDGGTEALSGAVYQPLAAGDLDGDGRADLVVGGPMSGPLFTDSGALALLYGDALPVAGASDGVGTLLAGTEAGALVGSVPPVVVDLAPDGRADLLIPDPAWDGDRGRVVVLWGAAPRWEQRDGILTLDLAPTTLLGEAGSQLGVARMAAADLDGDGAVEVAVGSATGTWVLQDVGGW